MTPSRFFPEEEIVAQVGRLPKFTLAELLIVAQSRSSAAPPKHR
jgi:hypothetical protein